MPSSPVPPVDGRAGYPAGFAASVVATLAAVAAGATGHPWTALTALAGVAAATAAVTTLPAVVATTAVCWAMHAGFVIGRRGELSFTAEAGDAATVLACVALAVHVVAVAARARSVEAWVVTRRLRRLTSPSGTIG